MANHFVYTIWNEHCKWTFVRVCVWESGWVWACEEVQKKYRERKKCGLKEKKTQKLVERIRQSTKWHCLTNFFKRINGNMTKRKNQCNQSQPPITNKPIGKIQNQLNRTYTGWCFVVDCFIDTSWSYAQYTWIECNWKSCNSPFFIWYWNRYYRWWIKRRREQYWLSIRLYNYCVYGHGAGWYDAELWFLSRLLLIILFYRERKNRWQPTLIYKK